MFLPEFPKCLLLSRVCVGGRDCASRCRVNNVAKQQQKKENDIRNGKSRFKNSSEARVLKNMIKMVRGDVRG